MPKANAKRKKPTQTELRRFASSSIGTDDAMLRQIIDIGDTNYFMTRAVEYIREAKMIRAGELHGSRTESERRDDWRQRISMAITLLAIAAEKTDASS